MLSTIHKKKFKRGLFKKIFFKNFQKNSRHFVNFENFDIFLGSFDRAKNSSSHEKETNRICIFGNKNCIILENILAVCMKL